jgi:DNA-3-methyladenine glycosylase
MIASPDRTPPPGSSSDRHVRDAAPGPPARTLIRTPSGGPTALGALRGRTARNTVVSGPLGHAHVHSAHGTSRQSA